MVPKSFAYPFLLLILGHIACSLTEYVETAGFGGAGPGSDNETVVFAEAARHPLYSSNVSFPGFDFSLDPAMNLPNGFPNSSTWTLHFNYSAVDVTNTTNAPGNNATQLVSDLVLDLAFPDGGSLPAQNNTNWTMCGHFLISSFPSNLTDRYTSETGNCSATLGADCLLAYRRHVLSSPLAGLGNTSCPQTPFWNEIPECIDQIGSEASIASAALMSWVPNDINVSNRGSYDGPRYGLNSTQPFFWLSSMNYNKSSPDSDMYLDKYAKEMRMAIFTFQPSSRYLESGLVGVQNHRDVRFVCGRADPDPNYSAAVALKLPTTLALLAISLVSIVLW